MVYCAKCGAKNDDDAKVCSKCGASLYAVGEPGRHRRRVEDECFGLPRGGAIAGLFFGLIIILAGASLLVKEVFKIDVPWWPFVVILFGVLIIAGAIYGMRRRY